MDQKDKLYAERHDNLEDFCFDKRVVAVFGDMLNRSIPGYPAIVHQTGALARRYVIPNTNIYDLGCSFGAATFAVRHNVKAQGCCIHAIDNSPDMVSRMESMLSRDVGILPVEIHCEDILTSSIENASFVIMNFTLQFLPRERKQQILQNVFEGLVPGGALLLSEKICFDDPDVQAHVESLYFDLKKHNGYNDLEISQKRDALVNVLKLDSEHTHRHRLDETGFSRVIEWYRNLNFASFIAVK